MVFQTYALYPHMTVRDNMGFALRFAKTPKDEIARQVAQAARILGLEPLLDRYPKELSGGQRQRVAIGRAIVRHPQVFLFDEPLSNLDAELRVQMRVELARLHKELMVTMIYVTHDQTEAMTLADRIVVLNGGRIEQIGAPLDLYDDPANRFVAGFIGSPKMNFVAGKIVEARDGAAVVELPNLGGARLRKPLSGPLPQAGGDVTVGVRPEHFVDAGKGDCDITVKADVAEHLGSVSYVHARSGGAELVIERDDSRYGANGDMLTVAIKAERALLFDGAGARIR
jgi:lactose/L-arabinose transport system ATP-binding protein